MDSYGPPTPLRDNSRSIAVSAALCAAAQVMFTFVPEVSASLPFGEVTVTVGEAVSRNVHVTVLLPFMTRLAGLLVLTRPPLQAENAHPVPGFAVSWTVDPSSYVAWFGDLDTVP